MNKMQKNNTSSQITAQNKKQKMADEDKEQEGGGGVMKVSKEYCRKQSLRLKSSNTYKKNIDTETKNNGHEAQYKKQQQ